MFGKKDKQPVATPWRITSTGAVNSVEFTNPNAAEKFWQDLVEMYPNQVHSLWRDGKLIKHN